MLGVSLGLTSAVEAGLGLVEALGRLLEVLGEAELAGPVVGVLDQAGGGRVGGQVGELPTPINNSPMPCGV